jgi:hypothetical protein
MLGYHPRTRARPREGNRGEDLAGGVALVRARGPLDQREQLPQALA